MEIRTIAVIGAGVMGEGVAQDFAQHGFPTLLIDRDPVVLERALRTIRANVRTQNLFATVKRDPEEVMARIRTSTDLNLTGEADFIIENVTEDLEIKRPVYTELARIARPSALIAVNTSAIPIRTLGQISTRPSQVLGIHFMNPSPLKKTVEMIRSVDTSPETLQAAQALMRRIGKESIVVNDAPGFVSNRVLMITINEAIAVLESGVSTARDIDQIFVKCFEHKMGPLATGDLIGLDTILNTLNVLHAYHPDPKFRPTPLLSRMVAEGKLGRKSGQGFFPYPRFDQEEML